MKVEKDGNKFVVTRGKYRFDFYVDNDSASWTSLRDGGRKFATKYAAESVLLELRRRSRMKAAARKLRRVTKRESAK